MLIMNKHDVDTCVANTWLRVGPNSTIETNVEICHSTRSGETEPVILGSGCHIRSGSVLYSGVRFGDNCQTGHHVVVRENTKIGNGSVLGTGVKVEMNTTIGNHVLIETQCHITGYMIIEDYVFLGPACVTTNDLRMLHRRAGAGAHLKGATIQWGARIGGGTIILPAVIIGKEAVIAAGSVVARDIPAKTLAAGNPVRLLGPVTEDESVLVD
jgi:UDP-2-acetamido-3-amino-2,3-dideoxy-glucuronate N-acetyltransferase